jgi:hypothetical protein
MRSSLRKFLSDLSVNDVVGNRSRIDNILNISALKLKGRRDHQWDPGRVL